MNLRRKRMILMDGQWYGYLRTASGNPLTLQNAKRLRKLTIYGNAVQDGTPSPDAPVEVQLCGDRTGNLFDNSSLVVGRSFSGGGVGTIWRYNSLAIKMSTDKIYIKPSTSYSIITYNNDVYWRDRIIEADTNDICTVNHAQYTVDNSYDQSKNIKIYNFTTKSNTDYIVVRFQRVDGADITSSDVNELKCMLVEGSYTADTLPAYEPYGYKVSGRVSGLNLFTAEGRTVSDVADSAPSSTRVFGDNVIVEAISSNGYIASSYQLPDYYISGNTIEVYPASGSGYGIGFDINVAEGEQYSLSFTVLIGKANLSMSYYDADGVYLTRDYSESNTAIVFSSTVPSGAKKMILTITESYGQTAHHIKVTDIMLVQGAHTAETMPPYEPYQPPQDFAVYLPEQIAKVGDVADEVVVDMEKQTAELVRRIERNEFKGTDAWRDDWFPSIVKVLPGTALAIPLARCVSNHFDHNGDTSVPTTAIANVSGTTIGVVRANLISGVTDAETFKTWLSDKNVYAYYPLTVPVTTDITSLQQWDAMPQVSGTVTLTLSAEVDPSGAEAVYYSKERGE